MCYNQDLGEFQGSVVNRAQEERDSHQRGNIKTEADKFLSKTEDNSSGWSQSLKRQRPNLSSQEHPYSRQRDAMQLAAVPHWKQRCVNRYTGRVSERSIQIVTKLQEQVQTKSPVYRKELQSMKRKEFSAEFGGSDVCYFCGKRVYVMERLSAEGKFFHRGCFKCEYCGETLRLSTYAYNPENGKFYCKAHYRLAGREARKRPATPPAIAQEKILAPPLPTMTTIGQTGPKEPYVDGATEPWQAKRLRGTPERIELENMRVSLEREEDLEEVPEETLAEHNLSSVLHQTSQDPGS
ncbi:protein-methionine sulfoxide oxidase mical3a-like, partial [Narcine bancroftii]|uniref:protein-methionine sulfoxide oxidase mical3a-like n=1 Tax=Narcine bancroftii TaxID=1343680 RepID=UPI0038320A76